MKASEAPEKIYYAPYGDMRENDPITENDIEYVRTDAFIDKVCEWLDNHTVLSEKWYIEDLKKHLEDKV